MEFQGLILDEFQSTACNYIENNINVLVSAPTGSGKTAIAEYAIKKIRANDQNGKIIYTCPIKSLCNEKYADMNKKYPELSVGLMTGDININSDADLVIMTTEVLYNMIVIKEKDILKVEPKCIIFDEVHYINDDDRGHVWEKCIITSSLQMEDCLLVLLSATIGNIDTLLEWLNSIKEGKVFKKVIKTERPVPLIEYFINGDNELEFANENNYVNVVKSWNKLYDKGYSVANELNKLCNKLSDDEKLGIPAIIFVLSKKKCMEFAEMVTSSYTDYNEHQEILNFYDKNLKEYESCSQYINLRKIISKGIAYHHSGLIPKIREVVEFLIKNKLIKIVFATETFAVGLNFPVKTVVMTNLTKPTNSCMRNLTVSEYKQMAGRAGRRFIDTVGNVIFWFYPNAFLPIRERYISWIEFNNIINGNVDNIKSKFNIDPNFILKKITTSDITSVINHSMLHYKSDKQIKDRKLQVPEKFKKLYECEIQAIEFYNSGMTFIDKNYKKLLSKLSKDENIEYKKFLDDINKVNQKTEYETFIDTKDEIIDFLSINKYLSHDREKNIYTLLDKGKIAMLFNEINPIIFSDQYEYILSNTDNILPILSMFIDDGKENENGVYNHLHDIMYFDNILNTKFKKYLNLPKWRFYPDNYLFIQDWLSNKDQSLDELCNNYEIDLGLFAKILIKMHQITEELINNLVKINKGDLCDIINEQRKYLVRYPLKIESLYI
jgi:superfamily II RNA helicase